MPPGAIRLATWQHQIGSQKVAECVRLASENELDTKICTKRLLEELEKPTDVYRPSKILEERERESAMSNQKQSKSITNRKLTRGQKEIKKALAQKSAFRCFTNTWPDMISVKSRQYA